MHLIVLLSSFFVVLNWPILSEDFIKVELPVKNYCEFIQLAEVSYWCNCQLWYGNIFHSLVK